MTSVKLWISVKTITVLALQKVVHNFYLQLVFYFRNKLKHNKFVLRHKKETIFLHR